MFLEIGNNSSCRDLIAINVLRLAGLHLNHFNIRGHYGNFDKLSTCLLFFMAKTVDFAPNFAVERSKLMVFSVK